MNIADNLNVGDWFVVAEEFDDSPNAVQFNMWGQPIGKETPKFDGMPYQIAAIGLPFLAAKSALGETRSFDLRRFRLQRVPPEYAEAMKEAKQVHQGGISWVTVGGNG